MPNYYNPYYPTQPNVFSTQMNVAPMQQAQPQQIQNGGFVSVRNEDEARHYPVAIGNSVTFKDESSSYIYTKTMGFSQLDKPIFEKYKLVKEEVSETPEETPKRNADIDSIKADIRKIWGEINAIKDKKNAPKRESKIGES